MKEIDRRTFLKYGLRAFGGVVISEALIPAKIAINEVTRQITGKSTGNASYNSKLNSVCENDPNPPKCKTDYQLSASNMINGVLLAPLSEEVGFRANTAMLLAIKENSPNGFTEVFTGTKEFKFSRRELLYGVVSSLIFGYVHNITDQGIDLKTIPASHTFGGLFYWYLQRRFGIISNIFAHAWNNYRAYTWK